MVGGPAMGVREAPAGSRGGAQRKGSPLTAYLISQGKPLLSYKGKQEGDFHRAEGDSRNGSLALRECCLSTSAPRTSRVQGRGQAGAPPSAAPTTLRAARAILMTPHGHLSHRGSPERAVSSGRKVRKKYQVPHSRKGPDY